MAKFNVNYIQLDGGNPSVALKQLTGMPVNYYFTNRDLPGENLYNSIKKWDEKHYIMAAACHKAEYGLTSGHAYTVLGVITLNGAKLVKMRNPWGSE